MLLILSRIYVKQGVVFCSQFVHAVIERLWDHYFVVRSFIFLVISL